VEARLFKDLRQRAHLFRFFQKQTHGFFKILDGFFLSAAARRNAQFRCVRHICAAFPKHSGGELDLHSDEFSGLPLGWENRFEEANTAKGLATVRLDLSDPENPKVGKPEPFQDPQAFRVDAAFSPDGKFIALVETDTEELFVTPFPGPGGKWKISGSGGKFPAWSRTGHQLFFLGGDDRIMVADYSIQGDTFTASIPRVWSPTPVRRLGVARNFDVSTGRQARIQVRQEFLDVLHTAAR